MRIGLVGAGRMGAAIGGCILRAGRPLQVYDTQSAARDAMERKGARPAADLHDLAATCDVVVTCLPGLAEVDTVLLGANGLFAAMKTGTTLIETSTIGHRQGRVLAEAADKRAVAFLDAPLSGGVDRAERGDLTATVGGDKAHLDRVRPLLALFCGNVFHLGESGAGYLAKAINQIVYLSYAASFCEAAALGERAGLDVAVLIEALRTSVAGTPLVTGWERRIESGDRAPGFAVRRVVKDLEIGEEARAAFGFSATLFEHVLQTFRDLAASGRGDADMTALFDAKRNVIPARTEADL